VNPWAYRNLIFTFLPLKSWESIVGIVTGYGLDNQVVGVLVLMGASIFTSPYHPDWLWVSPNLLSNEYWGLFPLGVKRPGREADHSPPTSAEIKKTWVYTSTPSYVFMA
jgi:hypothetical protein